MSRTCIAAALVGGAVILYQLRKKPKDYFSCLMTNADIRCAMNSCCYSGDVDTVSKLIKKGGDVNAGYRMSYPLSNAYKSGNIKLVSLLLDHNADVTTVIRTRFTGPNTALKIASSKGSIEIVQLLLKHGAKRHVHHSYNSVSHACMNGYVDSAFTLVVHGECHCNTISEYDGHIMNKVMFPPITITTWKKVRRKMCLYDISREKKLGKYLCDDIISMVTQYLATSCTF